MSQSNDDIAIRVSGLGKRYKIGERQRYKTLRESLMGWAKPKEKPANGKADATEFWALRDVNFEVKRGEVVGIIGRNGAGKSTLLKVLSRITEPTTGQVEITGRVGSLLEVGTGFHPELTGRENVFLNGAILGMREHEIRSKFDEIVAFAEIEKFIDTPVKRYSSGMYTRLAFAVAAHLEPEILIIDEVLAVGDSEFQKKCLGKMKDVAGRGRTVLFVSHSMPTILRLCERVILLNGGRVQRDGSPAEATAAYLSSAGGSGQSPHEVNWESGRPRGNSVARLRSARLVDVEGVAKNLFRIDEPVFVEVVYQLDDPNVKTTANIHVVNDTGVTLFSSADFAFSRSGQQRPCGSVTATCAIPAHLLAEGRFNVLTAVVSYNPNVVHDIEYDALTFQIVDETEGTGARGVYVGGDWPGVVRPHLDWKVSVTDAVTG